MYITTKYTLPKFPSYSYKYALPQHIPNKTLRLYEINKNIDSLLP